jgi:hypothetical protein
MALAAASLSQALARETGTGTAKPEEIAALIAQLDATEYATRRDASRKLTRIGGPAVESLKEATGSRSLETAVRALSILTSIYYSHHKSDWEAAEEAITELASSKNRSVAGRAETVLEQSTLLREERAVVRAVDLGAVVTISDPVRGTTETRLPALRSPGGDPPEQYTVRVGPEWKGGNEGLALFERMRHLNVVYLIQGADIDEARLTRIASRQPYFREVTHRGRACLGISGLIGQNTNGCQVNYVAPNSAAAGGGVQVGDVIRKFNGKPVKNFDELVVEISKKSPDDKVPLVVSREGRLVDLEVVLKEWGK